MVQIHPPWPFLLFFTGAKKSDLYTGVLTKKMKKVGSEAADRLLWSPILLCFARFLPLKQEKTSFALVDKRRFFHGAWYRSRTFSGSNPPTANFFRLLCSVYLPQKVRGIFGLKTQKTGLSLAVIDIPKPVFTYFTVFRAVFALKAAL